MCAIAPSLDGLVTFVRFCDLRALSIPLSPQEALWKSYQPLAKLTQLSRGAIVPAIAATEARGQPPQVGSFKGTARLHTPEVALQICHWLALPASKASSLSTQARVLSESEKWKWSWFHARNPFIHPSRSMSHASSH